MCINHRKGLTCCCYVVSFAVFIITLLGGVGTMYYFVESGQAYKYNIPTYTGQTVVVPLKPSEDLIHSLSLRLNQSDQCISKAIVLPCSNLSQPSYKPGLSPMNSSEYHDFFPPDLVYSHLYLLANSSIHFKFNGTIDISASVWVFSDWKTFQRSSSRPDLPLCSSIYHKDDGHDYCVEMTSENNSAEFIAKKDSFYFISCFSSDSNGNSLHCLKEQYLFWTIDLYWYDPLDFVNDTFVRYFNITSKIGTTLTLEGMYSSDQACVLVRRPTNTFDCRDENYWTGVIVSDVKLIPRLWLGTLAALPLFVILLLLSLCVHCVCYWNVKRLNKIVYHELEEETKGCD